MKLVEALMNYLGCSFYEAMIYAKRLLANWDKIEEAVRTTTPETVWLDKK